MYKNTTILLSIIFSLTILTSCNKLTITDTNSNSRNDVKITKLELSHLDREWIVLSGEKFTKSMWVTIYETDSSGKENAYARNTNIGNLVRWVSSNESVAIASNGTVSSSSLNFIHLKIELVGEGVTEIYAQTTDGRIKSEVITLTYGNKYNQEATAIYDVGKYVLSRLKYPTKNEKLIKQERDPWYFNYRNRRLYIYKESKETSNVYAKQIDWNDKTVTIKGEINTFSSGGGDMVCGFIIVMRYDDEFLKYEIVSERYDVPEIIRDKLE